MAQQVRALATDPDNLSSMPRTHVVKERTNHHTLPLTSTCALWHVVCVCVCVCFPSTHTINKQKCNKNKISIPGAI